MALYTLSKTFPKHISIISRECLLSDIEREEIDFTVIKFKVFVSRREFGYYYGNIFDRFPNATITINPDSFKEWYKLDPNVIFNTTTTKDFDIQIDKNYNKYVRDYYRRDYTRFHDDNCVLCDDLYVISDEFEPTDVIPLYVERVYFMIDIDRKTFLERYSEMFARGYTDLDKNTPFTSLDCDSLEIRILPPTMERWLLDGGVSSTAIDEIMKKTDHTFDGMRYGPHENPMKCHCCCNDIDEYLPLSRMSFITITLVNN